MERISLNELEAALLAAFAEQEPRLLSCIQGLRVTGREFSGVGTFTSFAPNAVPAATPRGPIGLDWIVDVPGIPNGLGASITVAADGIEFLEIASLSGNWDGSHAGFSVKRA